MWKFQNYFLGKIYPKSELLKRNFVSCDGGLIDQDYRGNALILMTNNGPSPFLVMLAIDLSNLYFIRKKNVVF